MTSLASRLQHVRERFEAACHRAGREPSEIQLVVVTKSAPLSMFPELAALGIRDVGENRVLEALSRRTQTSAPFVWHMVGHVQTNKARKLLEWTDVLHSVDRNELAAELEKHLARSNRRLPCYVQVNVSGEATKGGYREQEVDAAVGGLLQLAPHLELLGLMTMAPEGQDARPHFRRLRELAVRCGLLGLSMGMSQDFEVAIEEGATCIRIGSALFGH